MKLKLEVELGAAVCAGAAVAELDGAALPPRLIPENILVGGAEVGC